MSTQTSTAANPGITMTMMTMMSTARPQMVITLEDKCHQITLCGRCNNVVMILHVTWTLVKICHRLSKLVTSDTKWWAWACMRPTLVTTCSPPTPLSSQTGRCSGRWDKLGRLHSPSCWQIFIGCFDFLMWQRTRAPLSWNLSYY